MNYVLLLRAPEEQEPDRYEAAFQSRGYMPLSVPVLETVFVYGDALRDKIVSGPKVQGLSGVIITSKRAVEAWCGALRTISLAADTIQADWRTVPFYVVGDATAAAASQICAAFPSMVHLAPLEAQVRGGAEAGSADKLAEFILREGWEGRQLLYLTGDKNRDTLPGRLTAAGVALDTLQVYSTTGSSTFREDVGNALRRVPADVHDKRGWIVYFAPSAAAFVTPVLQDVLRFDTLKIAAIGPTTASFLRETLNVRVDVVASKPSPDALCSGVIAFDDAACTR